MNKIRVIDEPQNSHESKGPRNVPKKTGKVYRRWRQKQARKRNRGVYNGQ